MPDTPKITAGKVDYGSSSRPKSRVELLKEKLDLRRKSHAVGLKVASTVASMVPAYKQRLLKSGSVDILANGRPPFVNSISLIRVSLMGWGECPVLFCLLCLTWLEKDNKKRKRKRKTKNGKKRKTKKTCCLFSI